ncbi:hypothetical protein [Methanobrevibacter sp.]|uniref:hypothetical protein n=1 Tax=Methanobrevibacter sp. TaxID=66852 RepID=UPI0025EAAD52|nr:hypothetical protein [Methanobrevibacter sp.]MBQ2832411.1 hypothetical protein [Methanobrevibacter sp.]
MDNESGELVAVEESTAAIIPGQTEQFDLVDIEGAAAYMNNYQEAIKALLTPEDYQTIANKDFKKKSAWRKLATAFRISDEIVNEQLEYDDVNQIIRARYRVRCTLPNRRSAEGVGVCSIFDKIRYKASGKNPADTETPSHFELRGRFSNAEHDVPSTAHSRAKNRAIADLIGAGEVSAEEMEEPKKVQRTSRTANDSAANNESSNSETTSSSSNGKKTRRRRRQTKEEDVIETVAEVVQNEDEKTTDSSSKAPSSLKELADKNATIKKAVSRIRETEEAVTKSGVVDEVFKMFDLGNITLEEYDEANSLLLD